ncbi:tetratricopeptide repeat protein [Phormidium nigroviride]
MTETFLSHFTPSLMSGDILEQMLVQRQELAQELVDRIRESATTPVKHYTLLIGPRGIGKTHLISLIYHRVCHQENLRDRLFVAWLWEDNWSITSFLDLIISIFTALKQDYLDKYQEQLQQKVETLYSSPETAEQTAVELLKDFIGDRTLFLLVENLDQIFDGLGNSGQKQFLAFLQESNCCTIIATSPSLFDDIDNKKAPFYDFFRLHDLQDLTVEDAAQLLINVATIQGNIELKDFIASPNGQARIKAVHHLAGGNPRVYVIFSQFLTRESLDQLVKPFMRMLDDLTPYYQSRMQFLSPQQRKIVEFLCDRRHAVSVKEIAEHCFITQATASSQLKTLRNLGYVTSEAIGRESYYELREVLMRFCLDVKKQRGEGTIKLFVDFLRIWYTREELQQRLELGLADIRHEMGVDVAEQLLKIKPDKLPFELMKSLPSNAAMEIKYLRHALEPGEQNDEDPRIAAYSQEYEIFWEKEDYVNALQITDKLIKINGSAEDWFYRGFALFNLGRIEEASACYDKAIEFKPDYHEAWNNRGALLCDNLQLYEEAIASFDKAIEFKPDKHQAWYNRGIALDNLGRNEEAIASFDKAIEFKPDYHDAWNRRGIILCDNLRRFEEAIACYDKAIEIKPDFHEAWHNRGVALFDLGRNEEAIASYDKAIELKPDKHDVWYNRGVVLIKLERFEEAIASYDKAIELKPNLLEPWIYRGVALHHLGRNEEAIGSWDKAIEFKPDYYEAWLNRGNALFNLGQFEESIASYDKAIEFKPDLHEACYGRGLALGNLGRNEEAIASYDKAIEIKPDYCEAWISRGWALLKLDRFEEALVSCDKAIELSSKYVAVFFNRAIAILGLNRWDEGIPALEEAFQSITSENKIDVEDTQLIIRILFKSTDRVEIWRSRLKTLVNIYEKHNVLPALGQGLVNNIPEIMSEMISDKAARIWLEVWQEQTSKFDDFQIPLRLLNAAVRYRETKGDRRALLELAIEERKLLQSILDLDQ